LKNPGYLLKIVAARRLTFRFFVAF